MASVKLAANPERLTRYTVERTAREAIPGFFAYVIFWPFLMAGAGALAGSSIGLALCYMVTAYMTETMPLQSELDMYIRYFSFIFFGVFLAFSLRRQIIKWEGMVTDFEEQEYQPNQPAQPISRPFVAKSEAQAPRAALQPSEREPTQYGMRPGTYPATQAEMTELCYVLIENDWKFVRDVVAKAKFNDLNVFPNITSNWGAIESEWERMGYVLDKKVTDAGQRWVIANSPGIEVE